VSGRGDFPVLDPLPPVTVVTGDFCPERHIYKFIFDGEPMTRTIRQLEAAVRAFDSDEAADLAQDLVIWVASSINAAIMEYVLARVEGRIERGRQ
jgi:hypothetical protein